MAKLVEADKWAPIVGRMFLAFGDIELTTHRCIKAWAGDMIHKHFASARLSARIELAKELAQSQDASDETKAAFCLAMQRAKNLAKQRNLIAHNPLCLVIPRDAQDKTLIEAIAHHSSDQLLSYEELLIVVEASERCAEDISDAYAMFRVEKIDFESLKYFPGFPGREQ